jgi:hypothetical protein
MPRVQVPLKKAKARLCAWIFAVDSCAHRLGSEETPHFLQEAGEGGLIFKDKVIAAR